MRSISLAVILSSLALAACAHHSVATSNWKKEALANCRKQTDVILRQTCLDEIAAVEHERNKVP